MSFHFTKHPTLPRLAWLAKLTSGNKIVSIHHGPWVEAQPEVFFEGAWDGDFEQGAIEAGTTMVGSGGRLVNGWPVFAPPTNMFDSLFSVRVADSLYISNSIVFLLSLTGDKPSIDYPYYVFDAIHARRWGLRKSRHCVPTHLGRRIQLHYWNHFSVDAQLNIIQQKKKQPPEPTSFEVYESLLAETIQSVIENANHPKRKFPFRPLATVSMGYDSNAIAALAARAGCSEAFTFIAPQKKPGIPDDRGTEIGRAVGLSVTEYPHADFRQIEGIPESEFAATCSFGTGVPVASAESQLERSILLSGRVGEDVWGSDPLYNLPDLLSPDSHTQTASSYTEHRLRVGYIRFAPAYIGAVHRLAIQKITDSAEMKPWSTGGSYDRPIPRRILEEAGVPRNLFGQVKLGASIVAWPWLFKKESQEDFETFFQEQNIPGWFHNGPGFRFKDLPDLALHALYLASRSDLLGKNRRIYQWLLPITLKSKRILRRSTYRSKYLYLFHWGFEKVKGRYAIEWDDRRLRSS